MATRRIYGLESPTAEQARTAWASVASTNYVPGTVGEGSETRRASQQWRTAREEWPQLFAAIESRRVVVMGLTMWKKVPSAHIVLNDKIKTYTLPNGYMVLCFRTYHPAAGHSWQYLADAIAQAEHYATSS
jgi:dihydrofolate reductase